MVIPLSLLLLPLTLGTTFDMDDAGSDLDETQLTKLMSCALIASNAIDNDPVILQVITDSVHDPDSTLEKLAAELCTFCYDHISEEYADKVMDEGLDAISDPEASDLIAFNKTKYLLKSVNLSLTEDESRLMSTLMDLLYSESEEFDEDDYQHFLEEDNIEEFSEYEDRRWADDEQYEDDLAYGEKELWEEDISEEMEEKLREILKGKRRVENEDEEDYEEIRQDEDL